MYKLILVFLLFIFLADTIYSQVNTNSPDLESNPQFRSIQLDASTFILFINKVGIALDYDLFSPRKKDKEWQSLGLRFGADRIWRGTPGGPVSGSPFTHLNAYGRLSVEGKVARVDIYGGGAYQFVTGTYSDAGEKLYLKGGADLKIKLTPNLGLLANVGLNSGASYLGLGLYVSYQ